MLHCLLTVLFLLDFIKTPSAVSSGMVVEVVEEEMVEEGNGRQAIHLAAEWKELDSRGECGLPQWSLVRGTLTVHETEEAKWDLCCK